MRDTIAPSSYITPKHRTYFIIWPSDFPCKSNVSANNFVCRRFDETYVQALYGGQSELFMTRSRTN